MVVNKVTYQNNMHERGKPLQSFFFDFTVLSVFYEQESCCFAKGTKDSFRGGLKLISVILE